MRLINKLLWGCVAVALLSGTAALGARAPLEKQIVKKRCILFFCKVEKPAEPLSQEEGEKPRKKRVSKAVRIDYSKLSSEECLAMNIIGEAAGESNKGKTSVAYVTVMEARETKVRICAEVFGGRYDWTSKSGHRARVLASRGTKAWKHALEIGRAMIQKPSPPDPLIEWARNFYRPEHSSPGGRAWFKKNTVPLLKIGNHWFCAPNKYAALVAEQKVQIALTKLPSIRLNPRRHGEAAATQVAALEPSEVPMPRPNPMRNGSIGPVVLN